MFILTEKDRHRLQEIQKAPIIEEMAEYHRGTVAAEALTPAPAQLGA